MDSALRKCYERDFHRIEFIDSGSDESTVKGYFSCKDCGANTADVGILLSYGEELEYVGNIIAREEEEIEELVEMGIIKPPACCYPAHFGDGKAMAFFPEQVEEQLKAAKSKPKPEPEPEMPAVTTSEEEIEEPEEEDETAEAPEPEAPKKEKPKAKEKKSGKKRS